MKIVAITACPSGIAHTYMSAIKLESTAKQLGYDIKVERQGIKGIENELTEGDILEADVVIFAVNTKVKKEERFVNKKIYRCSVVEPIKGAKDIIDNAILNKQQKKSWVKRLGNPILTGYSHMVPLVVGATVLIALASFLENITGFQEFNTILNQLGHLAMYLMLPIFSGYIAYDVANRTGLVTGFAGGLLVKSMDAGFIGAIAIGLVAGYFTSFLVKKIKLKDDYAGLASNLVTVLSFLIVLLVGYYIICPSFAWINSYLISFLRDINGFQIIVIALIIGGMMSYDLGGPVNKTAMIISVGFIDLGSYICNTAAMISICIPVLGYAIYGFLFREKMASNLKKIQIKTLVQGLIGISEGAIPFTLKNEKRLVPLNMIASALGAATTLYFGGINPTLIAGVYGWFLIPNWPIYIAGIGVGIIIIVIGACLFKQSMKEEKTDGKINTCR